MKTCTKCNTPKPFNQFIKGPRYSDGYQPWCADCRRIYRKQRSNDPVKRREDSARTLAWVKSHPHEQARRHVYDHEYWRKPGVKARKNAQEQQRMQDPVKRAHRNMIRANRHRIRFATDPAYRARVRWNALQMMHKRRQWIIEGGATFTVQEWHRLCRQFKHRCVACNKRVRLTMDHIIALSNGGKHSIDNIQPLCLRCNQSKHTKTIDFRPFVQLSMDMDS